MRSGVRFAPSPTGRFHLGNLRTAWISERWARALGEPWVVRFEDIDLPRVVQGSRENQLADLSSLGLVPDRIYSQGDRLGRHFDLFTRAVAEGSIYPCTCSRKDVQEALAGLASAPHGELPIYTGHCRREGAEAAGRGGVAWRFRAPDESGAGDFIVGRTGSRTPELSSFVPAYHWACAIDDFDGNYRLLVRAADLASSTPIQRKVQAWISRSESVERGFPAVFHASLIVHNDGHRLEKRSAGVTLAELFAAGWTRERILERFLASYSAGFPPPSEASIFGEAEGERTLANLGF